MAPSLLGWVFVKIVVVLTNVRSTKSNSKLSVGYREICFENVQFKVLESPNLDVQYADLCVGLQHRRRWKLREEFANHCNRNGCLKHWRRKGDTGRTPGKEANGIWNHDALMLKRKPGVSNKKKHGLCYIISTVLKEGILY